MLASKKWRFSLATLISTSSSTCTRERGLKRATAAPDLPTIAESGVTGYEANNWWAIATPAGTPPVVISKLSAELTAYLKLPQTLKRFEAEGVEAQITTPAEMQKRIQAELEKWRNVAKLANIRTE